MVTSIVVGELSVLDRNQVREAIVRIPEVGARLKEVQDLLDRWCAHKPDLYMNLQMDDIGFARSGALRAACVAAVQKGLYDRYIRKFGAPKFLIGPKGTMHLLRCLSGELSLSELLQRRFVEDAPVQLNPVMFAAQSRGNYDAICLDQPDVMDFPATTPEGLIEVLVEEYQVDRIVNLGPGITGIQPQMVDPCFERLQLTETIEMDPQLGWFWTPQRRLTVA